MSEVTACGLSRPGGGCGVMLLTWGSDGWWAAPGAGAGVTAGQPVISCSAASLGTVESVAPGWMWSSTLCQLTLHNAWARGSWRPTTTHVLLLSIARSSAAHQGKCSASFDCLMVLVRRVESSVLFGPILEDLEVNLYNVNNKERCEVVVRPWVSQSFVVSLPGYLLCWGWWRPKGFKFGKAIFYRNEAGDSLKWRKLIIAMEGRNDCLLCPCGLLLASRLGFGQVSGSQSCSIFCVVLKRLLESFFFPSPGLVSVSSSVLLCPALWYHRTPWTSLPWYSWVAVPKCFLGVSPWRVTLEFPVLIVS